MRRFPEFIRLMADRTNLAVSTRPMSRELARLGSRAKERPFVATEHTAPAFRRFATVSEPGRAPLDARDLVIIDEAGFQIDDAGVRTRASRLAHCGYSVQPSDRPPWAAARARPPTTCRAPFAPSLSARRRRPSPRASRASAPGTS